MLNMLITYYVVNICQCLLCPLGIINVHDDIFLNLICIYGKLTKTLCGLCNKTSSVTLNSSSNSTVMVQLVEVVSWSPDAYLHNIMILESAMITQREH